MRILEKIRATAHILSSQKIRSSNDLEVIQEIFHVVAGLLVQRLPNEQSQLQSDEDKLHQDERSSCDLTL